MSDFPLSPDPHSAAVFSGNDLGIIATVTSEGVAGTAAGTRYVPVGVTVEEVLFGELEPGDTIVIRHLLDYGDGLPSAYEVGGRYVLMLNPAVNVADTGEMHTPNWTFPLVGDQLCWYDPDTGIYESSDLSEFREWVDEDQRAEGATSN